MSSISKHLLHSLAYVTFLLTVLVYSGALRSRNLSVDSIEPIQHYGFNLTVLLYLIRILSLLPLPVTLMDVIGLLLFNAFPGQPVLRESPLFSPFVCIRVVTRGEYPRLVRANVTRNLNVCLALGMDNFVIEVVTDKAIGLDVERHVREIVVPASYRTRSGAMFKARALQFCLENNVNILNADDWIVHLDEETILTDSSMRGILNFVGEGK